MDTNLTTDVSALLRALDAAPGGELPWIGSEHVTDEALEALQNCYPKLAATVQHDGEIIVRITAAGRSRAASLVTP